MPKWVMQAHFNIYVPRAFQQYKELLNLMNFDPCNCSLKIRESIRTPIPQNGSSFESVRVHSTTLSYTPRLPFWPAPLQALALVMSPRIGLRQFSIRQTTQVGRWYPFVSMDKWTNVSGASPQETWKFCVARSWKIGPFWCLWDL